MTYQVHVDRDEPGALVVSVRGEVDLASADDVGAALLAYAADPPRTTVVSLDGARYLDSSGLRMLYDVSERVLARGGSLRVALSPSSPLRSVFALTKVDTLVPVHDSVEEAALAGTVSKGAA